MQSLHAQIHQQIEETRIRQDDLTGSYQFSTKLKIGERFIGEGHTRHEAHKDSLDKAIEYALKTGLIVCNKEPELVSFSTALDLLKQGHKLCRKNWNGAKQWVALSCPESKEVPAQGFWSPHNAKFAESQGGKATVAPCITLKNAQDVIVMGWIPSTGDLLADDWMIAE